ncbi:MAG: ion transporter [Desulfobulbaceae bacterium]
MKRSDRTGTDTRSWRSVLYTVIFEADTPAGKWFDLLLIISILLSVAAVMLDSVAGINRQYGALLNGVEWFFTLLFTVEYILRLLCIGKPARYARSFFGIIDLLAILPTYISLFLPGSEYLIVVRILRILRVFRVLKLVQYSYESQLLLRALAASHRRITVFLFGVLSLVVVFGSLMYLIEGEQNGFTSIPRSVYWAIVTMTTVGYGDISPQTNLGQALAAIIMIVGYAIIAVPTGIVTAELTRREYSQVDHRVCPECSSEGHGKGARFCRDCGAHLEAGDRDSSGT